MVAWWETKPQAPLLLDVTVSLSSDQWNVSGRNEYKQLLPCSFRRKFVGLALSPFPLATIVVLAETLDVTC